MTFSELGLSAPILKALEEQGYQTPSPIQAGAIPPALTGRDVLGCAQTGTGKTCAFAAPILQLLSGKKTDGRPIRSLILTPTRELAIQIGESFAAYGTHLPLRTAVIFGGVGQAPQVEAIRRGVDILVATPGRLGDLYQQKLLDLSRVEIFVLDEADRMLDMGFIHDVKKILKWLPEKKQTLFFSATMPPEITDLVNSLLRNPARVAVDPVSSPVEVIRQSVYFVDRGNKTRLLAYLMEQHRVKNALVFTRTKHGANKVARDLDRQGISAAAIHGNKSQTARQQALSDFKKGTVRVLVATDIAARGLDIEELSHVFNYNLPDVPETYVHRIGRTGRAGRGGEAIALCDFSEKPLLRDIEKLIKGSVPVVEGHPWPMQDLTGPILDKNGRPVNAEDAEARAAARQLRQERSEKTKARIVTQVQAEQAAQPVAAKKKRRRRKKHAGAQSEAAPVTSAPSRPEVPAERTTRPERVKLTRPGTRMDTGDQMPRTEFERPDPLGGDRIMDATARLLAPRRPVTVPDPVQQRRRAEQQNSGRRSRGRPGSKQAAVPQKQAVKTEAPAKQTPKREARQEQAAKNNAPQKPLPRRGEQPSRPRRDRARRGPELNGRSRTKDSTEQKSLMKPYYLNSDD